MALIALVAVVSLSAQASTIQWRVGPDVTANDKKAIVELGRIAGLERPRTVANVATLAPGCHVVTVLSEVAVDGNRVSWSGLDILRIDSKNCWPQRNAGRRVGRWLSNTATPWVEERWRIRDGDWHVDLVLDDVPYADAERIVLAIRRKTLVSRLTDAAVPDVDENTLTSIQKQAGTAKGTYSVNVGSGPKGSLLSVAVVDGRVELRGYRTLGEI